MNSAFKVLFLAACLTPAFGARIKANTRRHRASDTLAKRYKLEELLYRDVEEPESREVGKFPWGKVQGSPLNKGEFSAPTELGKGSFGDTWQATDLKLNKPVAVKIFYNDRMGKQLYVTKKDLQHGGELKEAVDENDGECQLVKDMMGHPGKYPDGRHHICNCIESHAKDQVTEDDVSFLVLELCGTDLEKLLRNQVKEPTGQKEWLGRVRKWMKGTLQGIHFLSSLDPPKMHLDLKLNNVVATAQDEAKIIDFGLTRSYADTPRGSFKTTRFYPPEVFANEMVHGGVTNYAKEQAWAYDVWTFGSIYYNLICLEPDGNTMDASLDAAEAAVVEKPVPNGTFPSACTNKKVEMPNGPLGYGEPEDWEIIHGALALLEDRQSPAALIAKMDESMGLATTTTTTTSSGSHARTWAISAAVWALALLLAH